MNADLSFALGMIAYCICFFGFIHFVAAPKLNKHEHKYK